MIKMQAIRSLVLAAVVSFAAAQHSSASVQPAWLSVGDINNPPNTSEPGGNPVGSVSHTYSISKFELTNSEYVQFLSTKAVDSFGADSLGLYNPLMASNVRGGITRSGSGTPASPYAYQVKPNMADKPVNFVSWFDAARFCNWMHNGQGQGDTESGSYTLLGGTAIPTNGSTVSRDALATIVIPTQDEWYKAAYYEPGASADGYWLYGTRSDTIPTRATATPTGEIANPGPNVVNYDYNTDWNGIHGNVTTVGAAGSSSLSYYGAADMSGNVYEWTETGGANRVLRGGSFGDGEFFQRATIGGPGHDPAYESDPAFGFRIALVPEPSCALGIVAVLSLLRRPRPRRMGHRITTHCN